MGGISRSWLIGLAAGILLFLWFGINRPPPVSQVRMHSVLPGSNGLNLVGVEPKWTNRVGPHAVWVIEFCMLRRLRSIIDLTGLPQADCKFDGMAMRDIYGATTPRAQALIAERCPDYAWREKRGVHIFEPKDRKRSALNARVRSTRLREPVEARRTLLEIKILAELNPTGGVALDRLIGWGGVQSPVLIPGGTARDALVSVALQYPPTVWYVYGSSYGYDSDAIPVYPRATLDARVSFEAAPGYEFFHLCKELGMGCGVELAAGPRQDSLPLKIDNVAGKEALEKIMTLYPGHKYSVQGSFLSVRPENSESPLERGLNSKSLYSGPLAQISREISRDLGIGGGSQAVSMVDTSLLDPAEVTYLYRGGSARHALNGIVARHGRSMWTAVGNKGAYRLELRSYAETSAP